MAIPTTKKSEPAVTALSQPIGVCILVRNSANQILLGKRKNSYKSGYLGLPGGRVELHEPLIATAARELHEETGFSVSEFDYVGVVREDQGENDFIHFVFTCAVADATPQLCEPDKCEGWQWFDLSANFKPALPGHQAAIKLYLNKKPLSDITN